MISATFKKDDQHHNPRSAGGFRRTLYRDLIVSIVLIVTGVFVMIVSMTYGYLSHRANVQSADTLAEFSDYLNDSLELPIWNLDSEGIGKICNSFFENALVARLTVADHEGMVIFDKRRGDYSPAALKRTIIMHDQTMVGHLEIALMPQFFREKQHQIMGLSIVTLAAVILVLVVTLRIVLKVFLISPLDQLIERTDQISRGEYDFVEMQAPQQEIRTIVSRFDSMAERIRRRERSLKKVNLRLEMEIAHHQDAESALLNSREELNSIIRSTPDVIYRLDSMGRFTFVSEAIRRYGVAPDELIGKPFLDFVHENDKQSVRQRINQRRTGNRSADRLTIRAFGEYCRLDKETLRCWNGTPFSWWTLKDSMFPVTLTLRFLSAPRG